VAKRSPATAEGGRNAMLDRISESTSRMVESMNDIVWAVNSRNDELLHVAQRMQEFAGRVSEAVGFELDFSFDGIDEAQELDMVQRKNLYLIFKEAVNNAAKYSGCRKLTVRVGHEGREVVLRVSDDGRGMDLAQRTSGNGQGGGNGLANMRTRALEMGGELQVLSAPGEGTTVELRFRP
jgi:signal transduction histidine kinase